MSTNPELTSQIQRKIQDLGESVYEHFLREAGDFANPEEWYGVALCVSEVFREQITRSQSRNGVTAVTLARKKAS